MRPTFRRLLALGAVALLLALGSAFIACGGTTDTSSADDAGDDAVVRTEGDDEAQHQEGEDAVETALDDDADDPAHQEAAPEDHQTVVHTSLGEWSITGHEGESEFVVEAGEVIFEAHNDGATVHELVVLETELAADALPVDGATADEEAAGQVLGRTPQFNSGETELLSYTLEPGTYALICNIPGHYEQGMYASLVVE